MGSASGRRVQLLGRLHGPGPGNPVSAADAAASRSGRVFREQCLEPRVVADRIPVWIELQRMDAFVRGLGQQPLELVDGGIRFPDLCEDPGTTRYEVSADIGILTIDRGLLEPVSLAQGLATPTETRERHTPSAMGIPVVRALLQPGVQVHASR